MKTKIKTSFTYIITMLIVLQTSYEYTQCGVSSDINPLKNFSSYEDTPMRSIVYPKVDVLIIRKSNGSDGANKTTVETRMDIVKAYFAPEIILDVCIKEVHSDKIFEKQILPTWNGCGKYSLAIYPRGTDTAGGVAHVGGCCGWSNTSVGAMAHELGHMFSLLHTHNKCEDPVLSECANEPTCTGVEATGDGVCDTPADSHGGCSVAFNVNSLFCTSSPTSAKDRCTDSYSDPKNVIAKNIMSYYSTATTCAEFTPFQKTLMVSSIQNSGFSGSNEECDENQPITDLTLGMYNFQGGQHELADLEIELTNPMALSDNAVLTLTNCIIKFPLGGSFIELDNSSLILDNTIVEISNELKCNTIIVLPAIKMSNSSNLYMTNQSEIISEETAISVTGLGNRIRASEFRIVSKGNHTSISVNGAIFMDLEDGNIQGGLVLNNTNPGFPIFPPFDINLTSINVWKANTNARVGISSFGFACAIEDTKFWGFTNGPINIKSSPWLTRIENCESTNGAITASNTPIFQMNDCKFENVGFALENCSYFDINNNLFDSETVARTFSINSGSDQASRFRNNQIITTNNRVRTIGSQSGLKLLCNEFVLTNHAANFDLGVVDLTQGADGPTRAPAGNLFSSLRDRIGGDSPGTLYFHERTQLQSPNPFLNTGIRPEELTIKSECGIIGPKPVPDPSNDDTVTGTGPGTGNPCPVGINCSLPCPSGINCSQPCPPGIDCSQPCPAGIDCYKPCPPGIKCTQPCPKGINCSQPCPPGINCTQPCPKTVNCHIPHVRPVPGATDTVINPNEGKDPVLLQLEVYYADLLSQRDSLYLLAYGTSTGSQVIDNHFEVVALEETRENSNYLVDKRQLVGLIHNSKNITEKEFVSILQRNPILLYDKEINKKVIRSESLNDSNAAMISETATELTDNEWDLLFNINYTNKLIDDLSIYAIERQLVWDAYDSEEIIKWSERTEDVSTEFALCNYYFNLGLYDEGIARINNLVLAEDIAYLVIEDLYNYKAMMELLKSAYTSDRNITELDSTEVEVLETIALQNLRFSSSKAMNILTTFYGYDEISRNYIEAKESKLEFLNEGLSQTNESSNLSINLYPNPITGHTFNLVLDKQLLGQHFSIINEQGMEVYKTTITDTKTTHVLGAHVSSGIYFYNITDHTGESVFMNKIFIIEK